jgi:Domain of unknown function (DUF4258)
MNLAIGAIEDHARGKVYTVTADGQTLSVLLTFHALRRIAQWRLTVQSVLEALLWPEEVLRGHGGRFIAHRRERRHVVRVVYEYEGGMPGVITVYYPYAKCYFQGGETYEDRILS